MWADILSIEEEKYTERAIEELQNVNWATPLIVNIKKNGGLCSENMPLLFEVRFAYQLYKANIIAEYEYSANIGNSTIDFKLNNTSPAWLIELVSIRESDSLKKATIYEKTWFGCKYHRELSSNAKDPRQSEEVEMIRIGMKIGEKVFQNDRPVKFPIPQNSYHLILVDMRGFLDRGGDKYDYEHIACGYSSNNPSPPHCLNGEIIKGIFDESNKKLKAASTLQERIHFIGFVNEANYADDEIKNNTFYTLNHNLISDEEMLDEIWKTYPLRSDAGA